MIVVDRMLMRSTRPVVPPIETVSPTFSGRSTSRMIPLKKLLMISWRPKPRPSPNAATKPPITAGDDLELPAEDHDRGERHEEYVVSVTIV